MSGCLRTGVTTPSCCLQPTRSHTQRRGAGASTTLSCTAENAARRCTARCANTWQRTWRRSRRSAAAARRCIILGAALLRARALPSADGTRATGTTTIPSGSRSWRRTYGHRSSQRMTQSRCRLVSPGPAAVCLTTRTAPVTARPSLAASVGCCMRQARSRRSTRTSRRSRGCAAGRAARRSSRCTARRWTARCRPARRYTSRRVRSRVGACCMQQVGICADASAGWWHATLNVDEAVFVSTFVNYAPAPRLGGALLPRRAGGATPARQEAADEPERELR